MSLRTTESLRCKCYLTGRDLKSGFPLGRLGSIGSEKVGAGFCGFKLAGVV